MSNVPRTVEPISVGIFTGGSKVGVVHDRGQGQVEAAAIGRRYLPLGTFTTTRAAVAAIITTARKHNPARVARADGVKPSMEVTRARPVYDCANEAAS